MSWGPRLLVAGPIFGVMLPQLDTPRRPVVSCRASVVQGDPVSECHVEDVLDR
jgi:hypothetical protein